MICYKNIVHVAPLKKEKKAYLANGDCNVKEVDPLRMTRVKKTQSTQLN